MSQLIEQLDNAAYAVTKDGVTMIYSPSGELMPFQISTSVTCNTGEVPTAIVKLYVNVVTYDEMISATIKTV